jgi:acetyl-CoA carboxylase biotin carboxyl carrier protein
MNLFMEKKDIKDLVKFLDNTDISKFKLKNGEFELLVEKGGVVATSATVAAPVITQQSESVSAPVASAETTQKAEVAGEVINSPMVGTFYAAPSPDASAFAKVGDTVSKGQTLCIVEAMKIMNEIEAEYNCKIVDILVKDGDPVEFDMPLFAIERV